ncbi:hypothetical protein [uncultured Gammaproteobacteria bacterium]|jgi:uncharacterized protein (DUF302 family)|uniref:DUF302 domain-containing protein n=1 Tax=thiotrophic endosymbiont of Bathymodiolus puteoserpentis (Logatchev) TaxID=343240 RepID=UPI0010B1B8CE|nr:DUF302 domain-containing protein [thiotrophic endosymbiont of Bathymodiolus puteoserpentis (Logatchev)]CAC9500765.1 hypothetical protein [uncultured Gammaproteobacteria bacterium]CAC9574331.1 hypothetical protein [uncultured Gammaproteobacteria bacterium]CAC9584742.1 hypothetical protein [uncultured Gammaproteobacteria bacterium]CAC9602645.1 hypothetical protein [uncultured Gammaproteobacteria bacterium]CAC9631150.1 hypothetical protein [uncultured Gammaproteobacteria bacterium]
MKLNTSLLNQFISIGIVVLSLLLIINTYVVYYQANTIDKYQRYLVKTDKNFDDVMYDLRLAIRRHNYRITSINHIGEAIATNNDQDFIQASIVNFCNVSIAKKFIEQSLSYILYMPCRVAVYEKGDDIIIETYLLSKKNDIHNQVNTTIKNIVNAARGLDY